MLMAVCHSAEKGWNEVEDLRDLSDLTDEHGNLVWAEADIANLSEDDIATIGEEFGLPALAVEDVIHAGQRPKMEDYEDYAFLVLHQLDDVEGQLEARQISVFIGKRFLLTLHHGAGATLSTAKARWETHRSKLEAGPASLLHTIIDVIVDHYQETANELEARIEDLEDTVLKVPTAPVQRQLYEVKQNTARLRRFVLPLERVMEDLLDNDDDDIEDRIPEKVIPLFRDVHDHIVRIRGQVRNIEDLSDAAIDFQRAAKADDLNDTTKRLTGWAAIIAVPTLITGIYGMNVGIVPQGGSRIGFWGIIGVIIIETAFLYWYFRKKGWI